MSICGWNEKKQRRSFIDCRQNEIDEMVSHSADIWMWSNMDGKQIVYFASFFS